MNNEVKIFENEEFGSVRTVNIEGEPWLVGRDVAEKLGYADPRSAVSKKVDKEDRGVANDWEDEEGDAHITEEEFYLHIIPEGIDMRSNGRYIVYYTDGGVFGGHSVEVSGNSKESTKAQITG